LFCRGFHCFPSFTRVRVVGHQKELCKMVEKIIPEEELKFQIKIRVYGQDERRTESHSYLLDDIPTGVTSPIGELVVNIRNTTLGQLRPMLEFNRSSNMNKRSLLFQEVLFVMDRLPNIYNRPRDELRKYRFGFYKRDKSDFRLLRHEDESKPIADLIGAVDFFTYDLCVVPLSQIEPETDESVVSND
jgi:hypothetical protein